MKRSPFAGSLLAMGLGALLAGAARAQDPMYDAVVKGSGGDEPPVDPLREKVKALKREVRKHPALGAPYGGRLSSQAEMVRTRPPLDFDPTTGLQRASVKTMSNRQRKLYEASLRRRDRQHKES